MALRNEEIIRLKYEIGYNVTGVGADAYIQYVAVFDRAVQPYLIDVGTTATTTVVVNALGAIVTLAVAANPANTTNTPAFTFVVGSNVIVDVGPASESAVVTAVSGLNFTMTLFNAHSGTYPVILQGAEQIIRDCFARLDQIKNEMLTVAPRVAGLAALTGELEFFSSGRNNRKGGKSKFEDLLFQRKIARMDLAGALGIPFLDPTKPSGGGTSFEVY